MARKVSDMVLLLGSRGRARARSRSGFSQALHRVSQLVFGRSAKRERPSQGTWILPVIALLCFAGGYLVGGHFAGPKEPSTKVDLRTAGVVGELDTEPMSQDCLLVASYYGLEAEFAKEHARKLINYLASKGFQKARAREFTTSRGAFWAVVVYCLGERDQKATAALLQALPQDVPDAYLTKLREAKTDGGKVWPFPVDV
ncbi:MAG: hypothetical protein IT456_14715 [Planctomycetes bacterium]|nr:hypothetical protein [Planctomycetota bacterium]